MPKYTVNVKWVFSDTLEVIADSEEEALDIACEEGVPNYEYLDDATILDVDENEEEI